MARLHCWGVRSGLLLGTRCSQSSVTLVRHSSTAVHHWHCRHNCHQRRTPPTRTRSSSWPLPPPSLFFPSTHSSLHTLGVCAFGYHSPINTFVVLLVLSLAAPFFSSSTTTLSPSAAPLSAVRPWPSVGTGTSRSDVVEAPGQDNLPGALRRSTPRRQCSKPCPSQTQQTSTGCARSEHNNPFGSHRSRRQSPPPASSRLFRFSTSQGTAALERTPDRNSNTGVDVLGAVVVMSRTEPNRCLPPLEPFTAGVDPAQHSFNEHRFTHPPPTVQPAKHVPSLQGQLQPPSRPRPGV